jgi:ribonuclease R
MLPPQLSSGVCSLRPGEDRKAVTVEMELNDAGTVLHTRFYRSLIRSDRRLDYEQVERMFGGHEDMDAGLVAPMALGRPLAQRLRAMRYERGSLQIECPEPEFEWNDKGEVVDADPSEELESHWFIESYMVLANEQVASFLEREKVPTVYRVHDIPDPFNLEHLLEVLSSLGLPTPDFNAMAAGPQEIRRVMRETAAWVDRFTPTGRGKQALVQQVLRSQSRAIYQTANIGHFGLASQTYCHFTSPIRRYPDLLVHRGLLAKLDLAPAPTTATLEEWAEHCSKTEREAAKIELKADDIVLAHLLRHRLDENGWSQTFDGQIVCLTRRGMFVLFDRMFQGYLSTSELPRDFYDLNDLETVLEGRRTGTTLQLADRLPVKVIAIDEARGRVDLTIATDLKGDGALPDADRDSGDRGSDDRSAGGHGRGRGRGKGQAPSGPHSGSSKKGAPRTRSSKTTRPPQARRGR